MRKANWLIMFLLAFAVAVPASAVELTLGGFPSYMSTRARVFQNATYKSASTGNEDANIFFVDTTLRLTPQLSLSESVTVRAQVDVFDNNVWGGLTDELLGGGSTLVNSSISPSDKFRGSVLHGNTTENCLNFPNVCAVEKDAGFFNVRMLHADIVLPNNLGFVRVGRQPFDWGLGILANGGWDPRSDGGFLVDRFLWLKAFSTGEESTFTAILVSDRITQGTMLHTGTGDGWDGGAFAFVFNHPNAGGIDATVGGYVFPYIHQDEFIGGFGDLDRYTLYSGLLDFKTESWRFAGELQGGFGQLRNVNNNKVQLRNALLWAARAEYLAPTLDYLNVVGMEFGWADGDKNDGTAWTDGGDVEGGVIVFNPAYNLDNLLFKHVLPSIYQDAHGNILAKTDASVQNAYYARLYASMPVVSRVTFSPQILVGWNNETNDLIKPRGPFDVVGTFDDGTIDVAEARAGRVAPCSTGAGCDPAMDTDATNTATATVTPDYKKKVGSYLGTQIEGTFTIEVHPGVNLDIIGSLILAGDGLTDLLEAQALHRHEGGASIDATTDSPPSAGSGGDDARSAAVTGFNDAVGAAAQDPYRLINVKAEELIWGVQTKLTIYIDEFFKS